MVIAVFQLLLFLHYLRIILVLSYASNWVSNAMHRSVGEGPILRKKAVALVRMQ
jgi:uncharacterized membrane protein (DUF485 family)